MSDFPKVVGGGAIADGTKKHKLSESTDESSKEELHMNSKVDTRVTSSATDNLVEKIRDVAKKDACSEGTNGFHPISKDVNKIMTSFFSNEVMEDFERISENEDVLENIPRQRKPHSEKEKDGIILNNGCKTSTHKKKDD